MVDSAGVYYSLLLHSSLMATRIAQGDSQSLMNWDYSSDDCIFWKDWPDVD